MKKILFTSGILLSLLSQAQMKEGKIIYERTAQLPSQVFANLDPEVAARIPKSSTEQFELMFANGQSLYQLLPSANTEDGGHGLRSGEGGGMVMRMSIGNNDIVYHNFENALRVDQREIMDRNYVIRDSIKN